ncbi:50S ribosomal protein L11 methyltransferase [Persephonella sp.]
MKKLIYSLPTSLFEIFAVEFNGYGFEIVNRDTEETVFAIYVEDKELNSVKEAVQEIFEDLGNGTLILEEDIKEENWEEKWKEHFKPIKIPPFVIIPEWEIYEGDLIPIKLKIGKAFGTGLHPSTQIVLSLIPEYIEKGDSVLDIGTGSGILSIASKKIGAGLVKGIDIQPEAVEECKTNSWENEVEILCEKKSFEEINERYDIVLANLQIDIFKEAFDKISKLFRKYLIISGIYGEKERSQILNLSKDLNLELLKEVSKKDEGLEEKWYGFVFRHSKKD